MYNFNDLIDTYEVPEYWVSDGLEPHFRNWSPKKPVFISAPTGRGKNTFILDKLAPNALKYGKRVLILTNRTVLNEQQKIVAEGKRGHKDINISDFLQGDTYGNVTFWTYQGMMSKIHNYHVSEFLSSEFKYVVFDEAHFFVADAQFNPWTDLILSNAISLFKDVIRIYMSATLDEVENSIIWQERDAKNLLFGNKAQKYIFTANYDNYDFRFYDNIDDIADFIQKDATDDKWLIFVYRRSDGTKLESLLKNKLKESVLKANDKKVKYLDATKKGQFFDSFTKMDSFPEKVLIATSVLENGINIKDEKLKHIVIDLFDKTAVLQMMGRKRLRTSPSGKVQERVTVYLGTVSREKLNNHQAYIENQLRDYYALHQNAQQHLYYNWGHLENRIQRLVRFRYQIFTGQPHYSCNYANNTAASNSQTQDNGNFEDINKINQNMFNYFPIIKSTDSNSTIITDNSGDDSIDKNPTNHKKSEKPTTSNAKGNATDIAQSIQIPIFETNRLTEYKLNLLQKAYSELRVRMNDLGETHEKMALPQIAMEWIGRTEKIEETQWVGYYTRKENKEEMIAWLEGYAGHKFLGKTSTDGEKADFYKEFVLKCENIYKKPIPHKNGKEKAIINEALKEKGFNYRLSGQWVLERTDNPAPADT